MIYVNMVWILDEIVIECTFMVDSLIDSCRLICMNGRQD